MSASSPARTVPRFVAHRGVHDELQGGARENTLAAVRAAVDAGIDWIEIDVRLSRDGEVVLVHDETLERLWGDPRRVRDVDLVELLALGGGERRIPTLAEVLDELAGSPVTLLIDMDAPEPAAAAAAVVRLAPATRTAWCGHIDAMRIVRAELPDALLWQPWDGEVPPTADDVAELRPSVINVRHLIADAALVAAVHELGIELSAWTVDEPTQAAHLGALGVDSITSNRVAIVREAGPESADEVARQLGIVAEIAELAAERTYEARRDGPGPIETKQGAADHVTEVDRSIERMVRRAITAQFPGHAFVGEEYGGESDGDRPCWYLDPVDGTANLANGMPWTSFSLALVVAGEPVLGAVLDPVGNGLDGVSMPVPVLAAKGRGAWRRDNMLRVAPITAEDQLRGALVATELLGAVPWPGFHEVLDGLAAGECTMRILGSGTATLTGVALGRSMAAFIGAYNPIDHAAAVLIVREAGGVVFGAGGPSAPAPAAGIVIAAVHEVAAGQLRDLWLRATADEV